MVRAPSYTYKRILITKYNESSKGVRSGSGLGLKEVGPTISGNG